MHEYFQRNSTGTMNLLNRLTRRCYQNRVISKLEKKGKDDFCNPDDSNLLSVAWLCISAPVTFSHCFDVPFLRWPELDPRKKLSLLVSRYDRSLPRTKSHFHPRKRCSSTIFPLISSNVTNFRRLIYRQVETASFPARLSDRLFLSASTTSSALCNLT